MCVWVVCLCVVHSAGQYKVSILDGQVVQHFTVKVDHNNTAARYTDKDVIFRLPSREQML